MSHPIPEGYRSITPSLMVKGAAEAIEFYKKAFSAEEISRMHMPGPDGQMRIGHAELQIGDSKIFMADEFPEHGMLGPQGASPVTIFLYVTNVDASFSQAVAAGATVRMPLADMFWGDRFGSLVDPFGHQWSLAEHIEDLTPEQMMDRMKGTPSTAGCPSE